MSSLYYANALFSKYQAASSVFPSGVFPEQTSCAFASSSQRANGYGSSSGGASFSTTSSASPSLLYTTGGTLSNQSQSMYPAGYGFTTGPLNMHCSPFDHPSLATKCTVDPSKAPGGCSKPEQRTCRQQNEDNLRIYPWMISTGVLETNIFEKSRGWLKGETRKNCFFCCWYSWSGQGNFLISSRQCVEFAGLLLLYDLYKDVWIFISPYCAKDNSNGRF